jgi:hypothetical protein
VNYDTGGTHKTLLELGCNQSSASLPQPSLAREEEDEEEESFLISAPVDWYPASQVKKAPRLATLVLPNIHTYQRHK